MKLVVGKGWLTARRMMEHYNRRLRWAQVRAMEDVAESFLDFLKANAPKMEEDKEYVDSLKVKRLTGTKEAIVYVVVSERKKTSLAKLRRADRPVVVYVEQKKGRGQMDPAVSLAVLNNPWPPAMIPVNLSARQVELTHMFVSEEEFNWAVKRTQVYLRENQTEFAKAKARFRPEMASDADEEVSGLESMPDYMSFALRSEFGINIKMQPHWRPALRTLAGKMKDIFRNDDEIQRALYDPLFRKHMMTEGKYEEEMTSESFKKEAEAFQKRVAAVAGV